MKETTPGGSSADISSAFTGSVIPDLKKYLPSTTTNEAENSFEPRFSVYISSVHPPLAKAYAEFPLGGILPPPLTIPAHRIDRPGIDYTGRVEAPLGIAIASLPIHTAERDIQAYTELYEHTLFPLGIARLREYGQALTSVHVTDESGISHIEVFAQPVPPLTESEIDSLKTLYRKKRTQIHPDTFDNMSENETLFDRQLLYSEVMETNTGLTMVDHSDFYDQVEKHYAHRLTGLHQGFVTLDHKFYLTEVSQIDNPDLIRIGNISYLPGLSSLYSAYQLGQAGFDVRLAEMSNSFRNPLPPQSNKFAIMIRPKEEKTT